MSVDSDFERRLRGIGNSVIVPDETSKLPSDPASEEPYGRQRRLQEILGGNPSNVIVPTETSKLPDDVNPLTRDSRLRNVFRNIAGVKKSYLKSGMNH